MLNEKKPDTRRKYCMSLLIPGNILMSNMHRKNKSGFTTTKGEQRDADERRYKAE